MADYGPSVDFRSVWIRCCTDVRGFHADVDGFPVDFRSIANKSSIGVRGIPANVHGFLWPFNGI